MDELKRLLDENPKDGIIGEKETWWENALDG
jgi:hypothetical protein